MSGKVDLTGQRFGRLVVLMQSFDKPNERPRWLCQCDCGNQKIVAGSSLRGGLTTSCGCKRVERAKALAKAHITHGQTKTRMYTIWFDMKCRCHKESAPDFSRYGGRGIKVCEEWLNDFQVFYDWAMANGYRDDLTLDRIDNNKGYSPDNCRWADAETQNNNTRRNFYITYNGETLSLAQCARKYGIKQNTLHSRLTKYGWSVERALNEKVGDTKSEKNN